MRGSGPLRYPGAKANLGVFVAEFIERHRLVGLPVTEVFAGSAAVSLHLLRRGLVPLATLWEADPGAYAFWWSVLNEAEALKSLIREADVTLSQFDKAREWLFSIDGLPDDPLRAGFSFLFLNRTSYSGIVGAGPIGGRSQSSDYSIDCRFNKDVLCTQVDRLVTFKDNVRIKFGDGVLAVEAQDENTFSYVDPPYFSNGRKFYRHHFKVFDHYRLRNALARSRCHWLLSYDHDAKVEYLYKAFPQAKAELYHSARCSVPKHELLVSPLGFAAWAATVADSEVLADRSLAFAQMA